jgi:sugar phosphate isomerase/epimerase
VTLDDRLGIFARTFRRDTATQVAAAIAAAGYSLAHWNFAAVGLPTLTTDPDAFDEVAAAGMTIPSVSATFNAVHPDRDRRQRQITDAARLIALAPRFGADVVTLCTGSRDPDDMWRAHPANDDPAAWSDLRRTLEPLLEAARDARVRLGVEPEPGNVVRDAPAAARLLAQLGPDAPIGIILDPANLITTSNSTAEERVLAEAVDLVGDRVIGAQAKDLDRLDYRMVFTQLARIAPVPVIVQDVAEADAAAAREDLLCRWADVR